MYEIESGIPIPQSANDITMKYPLNKMRIGDSFFVPEKLSRGRQNSLYALAKKRGVKVSIRQWDGNNNKEGFRVWYLGPIDGKLTTRDAIEKVNEIAGRS